MSQIPPPVPSSHQDAHKIAMLSPRDRGDQPAPPSDSQPPTRPKWQKSVMFFAGCALLVFAINLACAIWATINGVGGIAVLADTSCSRVKLANTLIHLAINVLSSVLLAGSNFSMQCLMGPTRAMVDGAHARGSWLEIGVPSLRNFHNLVRRDKVVWVMLAVSSLPLHLFYNSAVFSSTLASYYHNYTVQEGYVNAVHTGLLNDTKIFPPPRTLPWKAVPRELALALREGRMARLTPDECIDGYASPLQSLWGDVLVVQAGDDIDMKSSDISTNLPGTSKCGNAESFQWVCAGFGRESKGGCNIPCEERLPGLRANKTAVWMPEGKEALYCLATPMGDHCKLHASAALFWIVTFTAFVKVVLLVLLAFRSREGRLLTVGDAIASFLERPDRTAESGPICKDDVVEQTPLEGRRVFSGERRRGTAAASRRRWATCICLWMASLLFSLILLAWGVSTLGRADIKPSTMYSWGIGTVNARTTITFEGLKAAEDRGLGDYTVLVLVSAISNAPQLVLSMLYLAYNGLFTSVSLAREWSRFGRGIRKGLRVSTAPKGKQRDKYFLQLPFRYGVPLMMGSILMHWLVGQSFFLVAIEFYETGFDGTPQLRDRNSVISSGWSPLGITLVLVVGILMLGVLVVVSRRTLPTAMPVVASCSLAIAAACHPPAEEVEERVWEEEVQWGIPIDEEIKDGTDGHLCFTSKEVLPPISGGIYQ